MPQVRSDGGIGQYERARKRVGREEERKRETINSLLLNSQMGIFLDCSLHKDPNSLAHAEVNHACGSYVYTLGILYRKFQHGGQNSW